MTGQEDQPTAICVLGMSRSGTSLTARLLGLAGVYLGREDDLLGGELRQIPAKDRDTARAANPEGFWEHYRMMRLNEAILRRMGGNWREPPRLPPGWEDSAELDEERERARALIAESFAGRPLWGWKDPRNSLTLPFWRRLVPELRCVICLRNPVDVASSLRERDAISLPQAVDLWLSYVASALVNTATLPRLLAPYESFFERPPATAARLAGFAGRSGAFDDGAAGLCIEQAINRRLWRHRTNDRELIRDVNLPRPAASLHFLTEILAAAPAGLTASGDLSAAVNCYAGRLLDARVGA